MYSNLESQASHVDSFSGKPRVFVLSDIGNEPDDQMSLTRLLLYSNESDVEGLVAVTSTWQRNKVSPVAIVNGDSSKEPIFVNARVSIPVMLSAAGTNDPDGNRLKYTWFYYQEAASAVSKPVTPEEIVGERGEDELDVLPKVRIEGSDHEEAKVVPQSEGIAHVILAVEDDGEPSLTSYRRVIFNIER